MSRRHDQGTSAARTQKPEAALEATKWVSQFADELRATGERVFRIDHPVFVKYGVTEERVQKLLHGSNAIGLLRVRAVFVNPDGSPAPDRWQDRMAGVKFSHREYEVES